jgi:pre-rRNA-processing protein TSR2
MSAIGSSSKAVALSSLPTQTAGKIDLLISLHLHSWPALTLAIQNHWGGPASDDKRDWFAGAISDLLTNGEVIDAEDLEEVLVQVMLDEFEVVVDDDSPAEVATSIIKGRQRIIEQDYSEVDQMLARWEEKQKKGQERLLFKRVEQDDDGQDTDWESSDSEGEDVDMDEAPQLVSATKQDKPAPQVDEDGFTKVVGKQRR